MSIRLLLVDDNIEHAIKIQNGFLDDIRFHIDTTATLSDALNRLSQRNIDGVLLDLGLPDACGLESVTRICANYPDLPVVVLRGLETDSISRMVIQTGAQDFFDKTCVDFNELKTQIQCAIERKERERAHLGEQHGLLCRITEAPEKRSTCFSKLLEEAPEPATFQDAQNVFLQFFEESRDSLLILDRLGRIVFANPAFENMAGIGRSEFFGVSFKDFLLDTKNVISFDEIWTKLASPDMDYWQGELRMRTPFSSEAVPSLITIRKSRGPGQQTLGFNVIAVDVSKRREMESRLRQQEHLASLGTLASGLAHEIGTPLGIMRGYAEYVLPLIESHEDVKDGVHSIITQIDRVSNLVRSLLNVARDLRPSPLGPVALRAALQDVVTIVRGACAKHHIEIAFDIPEEVRVLGDVHRIQQVFLNLMVNAVHAIEDCQATGKYPERVFQIRLNSQKVGNEIHAHIEDNGIGMAREQLEKIFEPFFTTKSYGKGAGLGLAICFQIMQEMTGHISVTSEPGRGTNFTLHFQA